MYDSHSEIIKQHKTSIDDDGKYREYAIYKKDGVYITECIEWRIKSESRQGGNPNYSQEYSTKEDAVDMYNELLEKWEPKK